MKIVHLLSQLEPTGAEVYAATLAKSAQAKGHEISFISERFHQETTLPVHLRPIHSARRLQFWREVIWLRNYIHENQIDVLHAHSRAAVRIGWWATRKTNTALVSTLHGAPHPSLGKRIFDRYGERVIAISNLIKARTVRDLKMRRGRIAVIGNPVFLPEPKTTEKSAPRKLVFVTRWTGPKGHRALELLEALPSLFREFPDASLTIYSPALPLEGSHSQALRTAYEKLTLEFSNRIQLASYRSRLDEHLQEYDLVIGAGRVAIAATAQELPCLCFGEAETIGLITTENLDRAIETNFGDISEESTSRPFDKKILDCLRNEMLGDTDRQAELKSISKKIRTAFDADQVFEKVLDIYRSARILKKHPQPIPVLMYHHVVEKPIKSQHRIFVTKKTFNVQMLALKLFGRKPITFGDLADFRNGKRSLSEFPSKPVILTFDDGYQNNLTHAQPILKKFGFKAVLYLLADSNISANHWDSGEFPLSPLLKKNERQLIAQSSVFEIGSHGFEHKKLPGLPLELARRELIESKKKLEDELGVRVPSFAFPYGDRDERVIHSFQEAGYEYLVNTDQGAWNFEEDRANVFRTNIFPEDGFLSILKKTRPSYRTRYLRTRGK